MLSEQVVWISLMHEATNTKYIPDYEPVVTTMIRLSFAVEMNSEFTNARVPTVDIFPERLQETKVEG
jgi:hypothetical protein